MSAHQLPIPAHTLDAMTGGPSGAAGWPTERKLRLFACGCCRRVWHRLAPACRRTVRAAERYADERTGLSELVAAWRDGRAFERRGRAVPVREEGTGFLYYLTTEHVHRVALPVLTPGDAWTVADDLRPWRGDSGENELTDRANDRLAADVFGGPVRPTVFRPAWRTRDVLAGARAVYRQRRFDALPALAARLERVGCDDADLLAHLRTPGEHARGCWALDRVLDRR